MKESNPKVYRELAMPVASRDEAAKHLEAFSEELYELRKKHHVPEVFFCAEVNYVTEDGEGESAALISGMYGNQMRKLIILAQCYGEAKQEFSQILDKSVNYKPPTDRK